MSSLNKLNLLNSYYRGTHDIANEFYMPCMQNSIYYDRAVGYFKSTVYLIVWPALKDFISRNGKMRVICSPVLAEEDILALEDGKTDIAIGNSADKLKIEIEMMLQDPYLSKPTRVLASLVALELLDFRIAFIDNHPGSKHKSLFHDKLGIFYDAEGNVVSFKGSMNETWRGLSNDGNLESVDAFVSWDSGRDVDRVNEHINYFNTLWNNEFPNVLVQPFEEVNKNQLINVADASKWHEWIDDLCAEIELQSTLSADRKPNGRMLMPHQSSALQEWLRSGRRGILEHATGSGKTFTALSAIRDSLNKNEVPLILVPSQLLLEQWEKEITSTLNDLEPKVLKCGGGNSNWSSRNLLGPWSTANNKDGRIILSTIQTAYSDHFVRNIRQGDHIFMVADEVHRLGAPQARNALKIKSGPRLGLSATPKRAGDPDGTQCLMDYFTGIIQPPFTIEDAINADRLTRYMYYVHKIHLDNDEQFDWDRNTNEIRKLCARINNTDDNNSLNERLKILRIARARIIKNAKGKVELTSQVINNYYENGHRWIIYCDNRNQLDSVYNALNSSGYKPLKYFADMEEDRKVTIQYFERVGGIIVAIRCLDEGVDIPSVSHALVLASSKNPREFIQRRGRILRKDENKHLAFLHDAIVVPNTFDPDYPDTAFVEGELARAVQFGNTADNPSATTDLQRIALHYGLNLDDLAEEGVE